MHTVWQRLCRTLLGPWPGLAPASSGSELQTCGMDPWALETTLPRVWSDTLHRDEDGEWVGAAVSAPGSEREFADPRGGFWTGTSDAPRFYRRSGAGDTVLVLEHSLAERHPVTKADLDVVRGEITARFGDDQDVDLNQIPPLKPYWNSFFVDDDGGLWVERHPGARSTQASGRQWEVYDSLGVYMGALTLPIEGTPTPSYRNGYLVGVRRDELDVQTVVLLEIDGKR